jgi:hypothetical protein
MSAAWRGLLPRTVPRSAGRMEMLFETGHRKSDAEVVRAEHFAALDIGSPIRRLSDVTRLWALAPFRIGVQKAAAVAVPVKVRMSASGAKRNLRMGNRMGSVLNRRKPLARVA